LHKGVRDGNLVCLALLENLLVIALLGKGAKNGRAADCNRTLGDLRSSSPACLGDKALMFGEMAALLCLMSKVDA